jgi:uncharacterized protein (TIGR03437 family)
LLAAGAAIGADLHPQPAFKAGSLTLSATHLEFFVSLSQVSSAILTQTLSITSSGSQSVPFVASLPAGSNFYFTISGNRTPATITVMTGIMSGVVADILTLQSGMEPPVQIPLTAVAWPSSAGSPGLAASPNPVNLTMPDGGNGPSFPLLVAAAPTESQPDAWYSNYVAFATSDGNWLRVDGQYETRYMGAFSSWKFTLSCAQGPLGPGVYTGNVNVLSSDLFVDTKPLPWLVIPVTLTITPVTPPSLQASVGKLSFDYQIGGSVPPMQSVSVTTSTGAALGFSVSGSSAPAGWLGVSSNSASTPATASVSVNPAGLAPGVYSGSVTLTPSSGQAVAIPVGLTVRGTPTVSASPASVAFTWRQGDPKPPAQSIQVNGSATGLGFSAQAASGTTWLSVSPAGGTAPATLTITADPSGLAPGPYSSSVTVSGTGGAAGQTAVAVTLQVTPALPTITRIGNAASYASNSVAPGEMVTIFGSGLGPKTLAGMVVDGTGNAATSVGGVQVLFNGIAAPAIYASEGQVAAVVPYGMAGKVGALVQVSYSGQTSNGVYLPVVVAMPGIFAADAFGTGPGAIANQDYSPNSPNHPAERGSTVVLYLTGEGQTIPGGTDGKITKASAAPPYVPQPVLPVTATIDGQPAVVAFYGEAPDIIAGVMQVNVVIPSGARSGDLPVVVKVGETPSQLTAAGVGAVTVSVR